MTAAAGWTFWGATHPAGGGAASFVMIGLLLILGVAMLIQAIRNRGTAVQQFCASLHLAHANDDNETGYAAVSGELAPILKAVSIHTTDLNARLAATISEKQKLSLELSLAETRRRYKTSIINSITDAVLVTDVVDRIILANPAAEHIFEFDSEQALRKPFIEIIKQSELLRAIQEVRQASGRATSRQLEQIIGQRTYAVRLSQIAEADAADAGDAAAGASRINWKPGPSSGNHGVVVVLRDITKEREADRAKSDFVSKVTHELRTPLSSIRAYVEMLVDGEAADEDTRREYYDIIDSSAERLSRMIDNMLNISRIEAGTVRVQKELIAVSMVAKEALDVVRPQAEEKRIQLTEELSPVAYRVFADRDMLSQAILNLLSNAVKYTPDGGRVLLRMTPHEENQTIVVEVSDTGVGIPEEDLPKMFQKFFRVGVNSKMAKGTGLGLNLVKHIVETMHEGKVTLVSQVGTGSTFGIVLPLAT